MSSGSSTHSSVRPRQNSPGWITNASSGGTSTSSVRFAGGSRRSIAETRWLWKTRKESPSRRSTLAGWTSAGPRARSVSGRRRRAGGSCRRTGTIGVASVGAACHGVCQCARLQWAQRSGQRASARAQCSRLRARARTCALAAGGGGGASPCGPRRGSRGDGFGAGDGGRLLPPPPPSSGRVAPRARCLIAHQTM